MGPVAGGPGIPGCPLQLVATCKASSRGDDSSRGGHGSGGGWHGREQQGGMAAWMQLQWGGDCSTWNISVEQQGGGLSMMT